MLVAHTKPRTTILLLHQQQRCSPQWHIGLDELLLQQLFYLLLLLCQLCQNYTIWSYWYWSCSWNLFNWELHFSSRRLPWHFIKKNISKLTTRILKSLSPSLTSKSVKMIKHRDPSLVSFKNCWEDNNFDYSILGNNNFFLLQSIRMWLIEVGI